MPLNDPATTKQMEFLWVLIEGANEMGLSQALPEELRGEQAATQTFQSGMTRGNCSFWIDDLIFRVGAVPNRSRDNEQTGQPKIASEKQCNYCRSLAQELAHMTGDQSWVRWDPQGRYSWTVSRVIDKIQDAKERAERKTQPQWGQTGRVPGQQQQDNGQKFVPQGQPWGADSQPVQPAPQPQWGDQPFS